MDEFEENGQAEIRSPLPVLFTCDTPPHSSRYRHPRWKTTQTLHKFILALASQIAITHARYEPFFLVAGIRRNISFVGFNAVALHSFSTSPPLE